MVDSICDVRAHNAQSSEAATPHKQLVDMNGENVRNPNVPFDNARSSPHRLPVAGLHAIFPYFRPPGRDSRKPSRNIPLVLKIFVSETRGQCGFFGEDEVDIIDDEENDQPDEYVLGMKGQRLPEQHYHHPCDHRVSDVRIDPAYNEFFWWAPGRQGASADPSEHSYCNREKRHAGYDENQSDCEAPVDNESQVTLDEDWHNDKGRYWQYQRE